MYKLIVCLGFLLIQSAAFSQLSILEGTQPKQVQTKTYHAIYSGIPWYDQHGNTISAHGAGLIKEGKLYYLFGEYKTDTSNSFAGFSCYSSEDLQNWRFENIALPVQEKGFLGINSVGERVKVLKCPSTGEFVMFMHADNLLYKDQFVGYATSTKVNGTYTFKGPLLFEGKPIKKWDMGVFQDTDGSGYVITHSGNLYKLNDDYKSVSQEVIKNMTPYCEAPAIFKKNGVYFWLGSDLTSWERNDNYYFTAISLKGPWTSHGIFAPKESLTYNSQTTYVYPIAGTKDTTFMFMGDRWSFPRQHSSATYVWQPLLVSGTSLSLPNFKERWKINTKTGTWANFHPKEKIIHHTDSLTIHYTGKWSNSSISDTLTEHYSDEKGASMTLDFKGTQIALYGIASPKRGYAHILLHNNKGKLLLNTIIDMYCKYPDNSLRFLSATFKKSTYKLTMQVLGEHGNWTNKKGTIFGSTGNGMSLTSIHIIE